VQSLHDINISLADNSISAFIGPSGAANRPLLRV